MGSGAKRVIAAVLAGLVLATAGGSVWWTLHRASAATPPPPPPEPHFATKVERGAYLFEHVGCIACHGVHGAGGVVNANYIRGTNPALDLQAGRMMLDEKAKGDAVVAMIEHGEDPHAATAHPPFDRYDVFLAQWDATRAVIQNGNPAAKLDPNGPQPVSMPSWRGTVNDADMDCLLAYLITQEPWDADGYAPDETEAPEQEAAEHAAGSEPVEPHEQAQQTPPPAEPQ